MNRRQANRAVIQSRAAANPEIGKPRPVLAPSTDLRAREITASKGARGYVRRSSAVKMTGAQRRGDGSGKRSDWSASPSYWTDPAWGRTVSEVRA